MISRYALDEVRATLPAPGRLPPRALPGFCGTEAAGERGSPAGPDGRRNHGPDEHHHERQAALGASARAGATVPRAMSEPLRLTIVYEDAGDGDGWVVARIPQVRGAISQGATREEARENVIDALRELLAVKFGSPPELPDRADSDSLELTIAA